FPRRRIAAAGLAATVGILLGSSPGEARAGFASQSTPIAAGSQLGLADRGVAVDGAGKTTVVWASGFSPHEVVQARRVAATGVASPTLPLSQPTHDSSGPAVASNTGGRSFAVWDEYNEP